ncbi:arsenate reductase (glutaredoxin) [Marivivens aquimaris]|uniref:arsenate reductase (glutaredoxin) n=1 Tax=Marivivens aquimaris TaxID=2774876 RepID=UPI00187E1593|nr:arsenate reductase (glutaredoxin) [Marivivens aquimaris]
MILWHNPRCSKSRETLALLKDNGFDPSIRLYLETPPDADELRELLTMLGITANDLARKKEKEFKDLNLAAADEATLIDAMIAHPRLIERPILINGSKAAIGRPPENMLAIL